MNPSTPASGSTPNTVSPSTGREIHAISHMSNMSNMSQINSHSQIERIPTSVFEHAGKANHFVAERIATLIREKAAMNQACVLGLATGSTPTGVYAELIRMHREEGLSFANVITFNLDEYYGLQPDSLQSYHRFMHEHLFDHVDIDPSDIHIPSGTVPLEEVSAYCADYEQKIRDAGGIDLQLLGIGRTGHIGFNEPGSSRESRTRLIWLDRTTRADAASDFFGIEHVPQRAITMGVATIMEAKQIIMMAFGEGKAPVVRRAIEEPINTVVAASFLQDHDHALTVLDRAAADKLTQIASPWVNAETIVNWSFENRHSAVLWLAEKLDKAILKLTDEDYNEHHLQSLLAEHGPAEKINLEIFRRMQRTITGWPAGKPEQHRQHGDIRRPFDDIYPKRVLIFSPHPDDDVISMGGTLIRLQDQGHEVHVAYQVSGNIAVFDEDVIRFADFVGEFNHGFDIDKDQTQNLEQRMLDFIANKQPGEVDCQEIQDIKAMIRRGEARAAGRCCGVPRERLHFMDMPFYQTGRVTKAPLTEADITLVKDLLNEIKPHQVYAAGDLSDPHGTHRTCLSAIAKAINLIQDEEWYKQCELWLYRGAWQEWEPEKVDMAVPISPREMERKRQAIFKHESQKDKAMFPGSDEREFWQRAEQRNHATARLYDRLGLAEYEAVEGFAKWDRIKGYLD